MGLVRSTEQTLEWSRLSFRLRTGYRPCLAIDVLLGSGESSSACSVRPADARSVEVMKGGGEGRRWLLAGSGRQRGRVD
jgi:hypothetical protein